MSYNVRKYTFRQVFPGKTSQSNQSWLSTCRAGGSLDIQSAPRDDWSGCTEMHVISSPEDEVWRLKVCFLMMQLLRVWWFPSCTPAYEVREVYCFQLVPNSVIPWFCHSELLSTQYLENDNRIIPNFANSMTLTRSRLGLLCTYFANLQHSYGPFGYHEDLVSTTYLANTSMEFDQNLHMHWP